MVDKGLKSYFQASNSSLIFPLATHSLTHSPENRAGGYLVPQQGAGESVDAGREQGGTLEHAVESRQAGMHALHQSHGVVPLQGDEGVDGRVDLVRGRGDVFRDQLRPLDIRTKIAIEVHSGILRALRF